MLRTLISVAVGVSVLLGALAPTFMPTSASAYYYHHRYYRYHYDGHYYNHPGHYHHYHRHHTW
jgi:hypothetical protein